MELLLNLIWVALASSAFLIALRRPRHTGGGQIPYWRTLLALACVLFLLFPIVSASDDLHPTQALEDAMKRVQHLASPLQISISSPATPLWSIALSLWLMLGLVVWQRRKPAEARVRELDGWRMVCAGRAPPFMRG